MARKSLARDLAAIAGGRNVVADRKAAGYAVDGLAPAVSVTPGSYEEVASVLRYADENGLALIPWGAGMLMHVGNLPARYDIALRLARLDILIEHEPADLTVTVQAGATLGALQQRLAAASQMIPFDASLPDSATVGGVLAANASGLSASSTPRDFTIGLRVVTADGRITRAGGNVVKNVAGYDLCKLYIGSLGTLGVIVEATFKTFPLPRAGASLGFAFEGPREACAATAEMARQGLSVRSIRLDASASLRLSDGSCLLTARFAGTPLGLARSLHEARAIAAKNGGREVKDGAGTAQTADTPLVCRLGLLPSDLPHVIDELERRFPAAALVAYPASGVLVAGLPEREEALQEVALIAHIAREAGGWCVIESCPVEMKREVDVFGAAPSSLDLMRRVKQQFDPRRTLSPGRFVGRL